MKNFGIKQIGFHQTGTVKGGLLPQNLPKSWGSAVPPNAGTHINSDPFLEYWFVNRRQNPKYQDLLYDVDTLLDRYRSFKAFDTVEDYTKEETVHDLGYFDEDYYNDLLNKNIEYEVIPRIGVTDFLKKLIYYPKNNRRVLLHEKTHALWAEPQYDKISEKVGFWNNSNESYDDNPDEIYSRLMELREYYRLDPNKLYSIEEILKLIQLGKESKWTFNILDRYTPEQIHYLINEVAYNPIETNSQYKPLLAKKGSKILIKKKNRGKFTEYCGGEVTNECILKAKKSKNPKLRKRATFALNARGWSKKHADGGNIAIEGTKTIGGYLPFIGTAIDAYELYKNPSWKQAGWTALGLVSDIFTGGSTRAVVKTARNLKNAKEALSIVRGPMTKRLYKEAATDAINANTKAKKNVLRDASFNIGQNYVQYITDKYVKNNDNK